jgi:spermidine synthase
MTASSSSLRVEAPVQSTKQYWRLFLTSMALLYLEIVLIRWIGTEVKVFAFVQNLSLIACFLGFGLGCFTSEKRGTLLPSLMAITALVLIVSLPISAWHNILQGMSAYLSLRPDTNLWGFSFVTSMSRLGYWRLALLSAAILWLFLSLMVDSMLPLGRWVGYYLETAADPISAYSVNLVGSIVGLWLLAVLSLFWLPPSYWFAILFLVLLTISRPLTRRHVLEGLALLSLTILMLSIPTSDAGRIYWSPYQKLQLKPIGNEQYGIDVNNAGYMTIANVTPTILNATPSLRDSYLSSSYDSPLQFAQRLNRVLIIGSGAGNDVAAALRHGALQVDAVEIDPLIYSLGKQLHPERPYESANVHIYLNDARNFLRQPHPPYDIIIFALLDSHTEFSGYSNMRVDNYVYTQEAFQDAKGLLGKDGVLVLKFAVRSPWEWMGQRFYAMLGHIFRHPPATYFAQRTGLDGALDSASVFIESSSPLLWQRAAEPQVAKLLRDNPPVFTLSSEGVPPPTTDDWPYVYSRSHSIPTTYLTVSIILLLIAFRRVWGSVRFHDSGTWYFFLLGAGFLLVETQLVSRLALYFGTTWLVNSIALTGVLTVLLIANLCVRRSPRVNLVAVYAGLCISLFASYLIPWQRIPGSATLIGCALCLAYCVPIFFAGLVFAESFQNCEARSYAFGANILGAVAGGLGQNLSFIIGVKALLLLALLIYAVAAVLHRTGKTTQSALS